VPSLWPIIPAEQWCLVDLKALAEANISPGLKQVAIDCAAAWPYRPAQQSIQRLIGVSISHQQIRQLCLQEAAKVEAQERANFQQVYEPALAETVEVLVEEQARPKNHHRLSPQNGFSWALMGLWSMPRPRIV